MRRLALLFFVVGFILVLLIWDWLSRPNSSLPLNMSNAKIQEEILKEIPIGLNIRDAMKRMVEKRMAAKGDESFRTIEKYGTCVMYAFYNNTWGDFLSNPFVTHQTNIYLIYKDGVLVDVQVERNTIGM